jgi:hypothetical protein
MTTDYSKEIYDKYYNINNRILVITLKDNTVLEGILIGFIHGDSDDPFIIKWHFVDKNELETFQQGLDLSIDGNPEKGKMIEQNDIKNVSFKK